MPVSSPSRSSSTRITPRRARSSSPRGLPMPQLVPHLLPWALACAFSSASWAQTSAPAVAPLPQGGVAVHGTAQITTSGTNMQVVTTNGGGTNHSVINWQSFNVGPGHTTNIQQPSTGSSSINRVVTNQPSAIFGTLSSNGNVILVNQNGIAVGRGGVVDTAGFTASTLNISEADAKAGRLRFESATPGSAGVVDVQGNVRTKGGDVILIAPNVQTGKDAIVKAENGSVIVVAGEKVEVTGRGIDGIKFIVQSPQNKATNLGTLQGDAVGVFAGTLRHSGVIRAQTATMEGGRIVLKAIKDVEIVRDAQSASPSGPVISANGASGQDAAMAGGSVLIQSSQGNVRIGAGSVISSDTGVSKNLEQNKPSAHIPRASPAIEIIANEGRVISEAGSTISANGAPGVAPGSIRIYGAQAAQIGSTITALAPARGPADSAGTVQLLSASDIGGRVEVLSNGDVMLTSGASVDVSGDAGGGVILVGGDYQGANADIVNAQNTNVAHDVLLDASARVKGNGGKVIVWADKNTYYGGFIRATGGEQGGDGGLGETSGKLNLYFRGRADLSARRGKMGTLLLDPETITIVAGNGGLNDAEVGDGVIAQGDGGSGAFTISEDALELVGQTSNINLQATRAIFIGDMSDNKLSITGGSLTLNAVNDTVLPGQAGIIFLNSQNLTIEARDGINLTAGGFGGLNAPTIQGPISATVDLQSSLGDINLISTASLDLSGINIAAGGGKNVQIFSYDTIELNGGGTSNTITGEQIILQADKIQLTGSTTMSGRVQFAPITNNRTIEIGDFVSTPNPAVLHIRQNLIDAVVNDVNSVVTFGGTPGFTGNITTSTGAPAVLMADRRFELITAGSGSITNGAGAAFQSSPQGNLYAQTQDGSIELGNTANSVAGFGAKSDKGAITFSNSNGSIYTRLYDIETNTSGSTTSAISLTEFGPGFSVVDEGVAIKSNGGDISITSPQLTIAGLAGGLVIDSSPIGAADAGNITLTTSFSADAAGNSLSVVAISNTGVASGTVVQLGSANNTTGSYLDSYTVDASNTGGGAAGTINMQGKSIQIGSGTIDLNGNMTVATATTTLSAGNHQVNGVGSIVLTGSINTNISGGVPSYGTGNLVVQAAQGSGQGTVLLNANVGTSANERLNTLDFRNARVTFNSDSGLLRANDLLADGASTLTLGRNQEWIIDNNISTNGADLDLAGFALGLARNATFGTLIGGGTINLKAGGLNVTINDAVASNVGLTLRTTGTGSGVIFNDGIVGDASTANFDIAKNTRLTIQRGSGYSNLTLGGTTVVNGTLELLDGGGSGTLTNTGILTGGGVIEMEGRGFRNQGILRPGDQSVVAPSSLTFDRVQNTFDLSDPTSKVEIRAFADELNDVIHLTDNSGNTQINVALGGVLRITEQGAYTVALGDGFNVLRSVTTVPLQPALVYASGKESFASAQLASGRLLTAASPTSPDYRLEVAATNVTWDGGAGTLNWQDAGNWSGDFIPIVGDNVVLDPTGSATVQFGDGITAFTVSGLGSFSMPDASDKLAINTNAVFNMPTTNLIAGGIVINGGQLNLLGATTIGGGLDFANGGKVDFSTVNASLRLGGSSDSEWTGGRISNSGGSANGLILDAGGTINANGGAVEIEVSVVNNGILNVSGTSLLLSSSYTQSGSLNISGGQFALTNVSNGIVAMAGGLQITGGQFDIGNDTVNFTAGTLDWRNGAILGAGGTLNVAGVTMTGNGLRVLNGVTLLAGNPPAVSPITLSAGSLTIENATLNTEGNNLVINSGASLSLNNGSGLNLAGGVLDNQGSFNFNQNSTFGLALAATQSGVFNLSSGATWDIGSQSVTFAPTAQINGGTLRVSTGGDATVMGVLNRGANSITDIDGGSLTLSGTGSELITSTLRVQNVGALNGTGKLKVTDNFEMLTAGTVGQTFESINITQSSGDLRIAGRIGAKDVTLNAVTGDVIGGADPIDVKAINSLTVEGRNISLDTEVAQLNLSAFGTGLQSIRNTGDLQITSFSTTGGSAELIVNGSITQTGPMVVGGATRLQTLSTGHDITLLSSGNQFGGVVTLDDVSGFVQLSGGLSSLTVAGKVNNSLALAGPANVLGSATTGLTVSGNLNVFTAGSITQTTGSSLTVGGLTTLQANGDIVLNSGINTFSATQGIDVTTGAGKNVSVAAVGGLVIRGDVGGDLSIDTNGGNITQSGALIVRGNQATFNAGSSDILLNAAGNQFNRVVFTGNLVNIADSSTDGVIVAGTAAQGVILTAAGDIGSSGLLQASNLSINSTAGNLVDVSLTNLAVNGQTSINGAPGLYGDVTLTNSVASGTYGSTLNASGTLTINHAGAVELPGGVIGNLVVNAKGAVTDSANSMTVSGVTTIIALNSGTGQRFDVTLNGSNNLGQNINVAAANVDVYSNNVMDPNVDATGSVILRSASSVIQSADRGIIGASSLELVAGAGIDLKGTNQIITNVDLTTTAGDIAISGGTTANTLNASSAGALNVTGFQSAFTNLNVTTASDASLELAGDLNFGAMSIGGNSLVVKTTGSLLSSAGPLQATNIELEAATIGKNGAITMAAPNVRLKSNSGDINVVSTTASTIQSLSAAGNANYSTTLNTTIAGAVDVQGTFNLDAGRIAVLANVNAGQIDWNAGSGDIIINAAAGSVTVKGNNSIVLVSNDVVLQAGAGSAQLETGGSLNVNANGNFILEGGTAANASAKVLASGPVNITVAGIVDIQGGSSQGAFAELDPTSGQPMVINASAVNLTGGAAAGAYAAITSQGDITINASSLTLVGGPATDADAVVFTTGGNVSLPANCIGCDQLNAFPWIGNGQTDVGIVDGARFVQLTQVQTGGLGGNTGSGGIVAIFDDSFDDLIEPVRDTNGGGVVVDGAVSCP